MYQKYSNNDIINKQYNTCGCIIISELDIFENKIIEIYIQYCKTHYNIPKINDPIINNSKKYFYDSKLQKYILTKDNQNINNLSSMPMKKIKSCNLLLDNKLINKTISLKKSNSIANIHKISKAEHKLITLNSIQQTNISNITTLMEFGKYYNKTYNYVYYNDKMYCYKLAFWNDRQIKNKKIENFINYIKHQLLIE